MKWILASMLDPGDGIVTLTTIEHSSDDIIEVCSDAINGDCVDADGEPVIINGWVFSAEAQPPEE
jgi:hypothetical protein